MRFEAFDEMARALPGVTLDIKWGEDRVFCVGEKMFAHAGPIAEEAPRYLFKASDVAFEMLTESGLATPAPYLARAKWVQLSSNDALSDEDLTAYIREAHALVAAKLTKKERMVLGL